MTTKIICIAGREKAGKTTIALLLTNIYQESTYQESNYQESNYQEVEPVNYINKEFKQFISIEKLYNLLKQFVDPNYQFPAKVLMPIKKITENNISKKCIINFSDALKELAACIFEFNVSNVYQLLEGNFQFKELRETVLSKKYKLCGSLTGRQCLEFFGTNIIRNNFSSNIWVEICVNKINKLKPELVIIPDLRFENEYEYFKNIAIFVLVYRNINDLVITELDKTKHISKWGFLNFYPKNCIQIINDGTIDDLKIQLQKKIII